MSPRRHHRPRFDPDKGFSLPSDTDPAEALRRGRGAMPAGGHTGKYLGLCCDTTGSSDYLRGRAISGKPPLGVLEARPGGERRDAGTDSLPLFGACVPLPPSSWRLLPGPSPCPPFVALGAP